MKIEEIKLKWLEISLNELGRHEEFESLDLDDLKNIANMGIDDLRDKYISKKSKNIVCILNKLMMIITIIIKIQKVNKICIFPKKFDIIKGYSKKVRGVSNGRYRKSRKNNEACYR